MANPLIHEGQCTNYFNNDWHSRCPRPATVLLYNQDGNPVPGCYSCGECAASVLAEYRDKLGLNWTARPIAMPRDGEGTIPPEGESPPCPPRTI